MGFSSIVFIFHNNKVLCGYEVHINMSVFGFERKSIFKKEQSYI